MFLNLFHSWTKRIRSNGKFILKSKFRWCSLKKTIINIASKIANQNSKEFHAVSMVTCKNAWYAGMLENTYMNKFITSKLGIWELSQGSMALFKKYKRSCRVFTDFVLLSHPLLSGKSRIKIRRSFSSIVWRTYTSLYMLLLG